MAGDTTAEVAAERKLRILMLHGFTQTGRLFELKTKALKKALEKELPAKPKPGYLEAYPGGVELVYPTAPIRLDPTDIPGYDVQGDSASPEAYGWWRRKDDSMVYAGFEDGLRTIAETLKAQGPFDGVLGFSQGGAAAGITASLLEQGRKEAFDASKVKDALPYPSSFLASDSTIVHPPLKFAVSYSGFAAPHPMYKALYEPKITTPVLHFLGSVDTVVSEERSLLLVEACANARGVPGGAQRVIYHPGGHFLPSSGKNWSAALIAFIRESIGANSNANKVKDSEEENVEDMDVPF